MCRLVALSTCVLLLLVVVVEAAIRYTATNERLYTYPKAGQYKYVAQISSKAGFCTATIVSKEWLLTAAHCLYFREKRINDKDVRVIAGVTNYERPNRDTRHETMSIRLEVHPKFWYNWPAKFDVALIKVRDPFEFNDYIGSVEVAGSEWPQDNATQECFTLGFGGFYSTAPATTVLKRLDRTATHGATACPCAKRFQWKRIVCVVEDGANLMCKGDDGGPLVCGGVVWGLAHAIWNRGNCDGIMYPLPKCVGSPDKGLSVYTFLCPVNDWLNSVEPAIPVTPDSCRAAPAAAPHRFRLGVVIVGLVLLK